MLWSPHAVMCLAYGKGFSYAIPVASTVPLTVAVLILACGLRNDDECRFKGTIPDYLFFSCPGGDFIQVPFYYVFTLSILLLPCPVFGGRSLNPGTINPYRYQPVS